MTTSKSIPYKLEWDSDPDGGDTFTLRRVAATSQGDHSPTYWAEIIAFVWREKADGTYTVARKFESVGLDTEYTRGLVALPNAFTVAEAHDGALRTYADDAAARAERNRKVAENRNKLINTPQPAEA